MFAAREHSGTCGGPDRNRALAVASACGDRVREERGIAPCQGGARDSLVPGLTDQIRDHDDCETMTAISEDRLLAEVTGSTATVAGLIDGADLTRQVPTCPDWTLRQLTTHLGRAHRWAAEMIDRRVKEPLSFREAPGGRLPDDPAEHPGWLAEGAARLAASVRAAGTDLVLDPHGHAARQCLGAAYGARDGRPPC